MDKSFQPSRIRCKFLNLDLSICIPVYNRDVLNLANELSNQASKLSGDIEIIFLDDNSHQEIRVLNKTVGSLSNVIYEELSANAGRSKIRNILSSKAKSNFIVFLDCDMKVSNPGFLKQYIDNRIDGVVCGGHLYAEEVTNQNFKLHWLYGKTKEVQTVSQRKEKPYRSFKTSNFLIAKTVFHQVKFNENLTQYGHEDTLFGLELEKEEILIRHIENPVLHEGLEKAEDFILKTERAIENLKQIMEINPSACNRIKIYSTYRKLKVFGLDKWIKKVYLQKRKDWRNQLIGKNPSLNVLRKYKLGMLCSIMS